MRIFQKQLHLKIFQRRYCHFLTVPIKKGKEKISSKKRSKLITPRTSKANLKMEIKMKLKSEEKREVGKGTHCIICAETFEEDWIQCRICDGWSYENCADLEGNNLFY
ncbi:hypothetical protein AVEN_225390-1 [Araneus ventricosus]|uniref:Uncharacterized protein n=1 Tax=Araneus ventricosus TaxID=182803 RepID=A0A4Y2HXM4_ARAVE|nr:hypothetical protein AVEN_225390-1 [Araneus ventricosus]